MEEAGFASVVALLLSWMFAIVKYEIAREAKTGMARIGRRFKIGLSIDEIKPLLGKKIHLTSQQIQRALSIIGIGRSGIKNLSESIHEYRQLKKTPGHG